MYPVRGRKDYHDALPPSREWTSGASPPDLGEHDWKVDDEHKKQWPKHLTKLTRVYNLTRSVVTGYSPHFLMFGWRPRLPIDFLFPTHEVMGKMKPIDAYVAELIGTLRKAFKIARGITQEEATRQK